MFPRNNYNYQPSSSPTTNIVVDYRIGTESEQTAGIKSSSGVLPWYETLLTEFLTDQIEKMEKVESAFSLAAQTIDKYGRQR